MSLTGVLAALRCLTYGGSALPFTADLLEGLSAQSATYTARVQRGSSETARCTSKGDRLALPASCCGLLHSNFSAMAYRGGNPNLHIG